LDVAPKVTFDKSFTSDYDQEKGKLALKELRINNYKEIFRHLKKYLKPNGRGLEVGCAYGLFLEMLRNNNVACTGIEPEPDLAERARQRGHNIITGFFPDDLKGQVSNVDFIIFNDVFEHIPDIKKTVDSCHQLLSRDGILIINLPLSSGFFYKAGTLLYKLGRKQPMERLWQLQFHSPHFHYFNKENITRFLEANGFKLDNFHHLTTITKDTIKYRIEMDKNQSIVKKTTIGVLKLLFPLIKTLPKDIGCFYFRPIK
jgi:2-polyprenyl-3-methyl-5-hydroxy-6-metoxy-1,4-benzoquinol methylase